MIELDVHPFCHTCDGFDPVAVKIMGFDSELQITNVRCENHRKCMAISRHIEKELNKNDTDI